MTDQIETYYKGFPSRHVLNKVGYLLANKHLCGGKTKYSDLMDLAVNLLKKEKEDAAKKV